MRDYAKIVEDLVAHPAEEDWFELKENWFEPRMLGEYISSLSNAAAMLGRDAAYFVWGVSDRTHAIIGTSFRWHRDVDGEPLEHWLARKVSPDIGFSFHEADVKDARVVVLEVPAARTVPTSFDGERFIRIGSSKERLSRYPEREAQLFDVLRHGLPTIDNTESAYQGLTFDRLFTFYAGRGITLREETFRQNLGLLTGNGSYNVLAQLLADESRIPVRVSKVRPVLSPLREQIIGLMRDDPNITQKRIAGQLGIGHTSLADNIAWLRDNGYVVREGSRKSGWWRVL